MESQEEEEDIMESDSEGEEEEPVYTSWIGPDGITVHGIMSVDDGILRLKNRCQFDDCSICYNKPSTTHGKHQICCLPCGHMYGFSCIKKWLLQSSSSGKCPQCNTFCTIQDAILLYPPPLCVTAHQQASLAAFFPLTKQGFYEFKEYETSRALDALLLQAHDLTHMNIFVRKHNDLVLRARELTRQSDNLLTQAEELEERPESLGLADALRRRASPLKPQIDALGRRTDALKRLASALRRRSDAFRQRSDAFESRLALFAQMYKEHGKTKKNNNEPCTTCMEKRDKKKMQASGTVEVPKEEPVEDVEEGT
ncbi:zinc finger, RING/FYVE/PHD-type containing protein [Tanacetum coccineum]|uniref:Zinc finger, RING/FYVE/PHD-type containing protein n=1 Tax=Tanacetum coccineum TaxID=301880 RepID=A0ABQ5D2Y0_9ASTR